MLKAIPGEDFLKITIEKTEVVGVVNEEVEIILNNIAELIIIAVIIVGEVEDTMTIEMCTIKKEIVQFIDTISITISVANYV